MLLRICIIVAILAALATGVVSHVKVADKILTIETERDANGAQRDQARQAETKAKAEAKKAKEEQDLAAKELAETAATLETTTAKANEQQKRADSLQTELNKTLQDRNDARAELSAWMALGIPVEQIKGRLAEIKEVRGQLDVFDKENKLLNRDLKKTKVELERYTGTKEVEVPLPPGLKGKVVAVDPKWAFVVLDIGENQGVVEMGKLMVNRGGKLVAKVQVVRVESERCIANVLPEWKQSDVLEGDVVLY